MAKAAKNGTYYIEIAKIKPNPKNPRVIKDEKYRRLCTSLRNFPEMLDKRPLVCFTDIDGKLVVLGGNMRLKAATELGMKTLPVTLADDWTEEQRAEFLIKDNVGFGEWNWEELQADWDVTQLAEWGLDVPGFDLSPDGLGEDFSLKDGDKEPFQQMTFTLADAQAERIKAAMADVEVQPGTEYGNENGNGNKLHQIVLEWAELRK